MKRHCAIFIILSTLCSAVSAHTLNGATDSLKKLISPKLRNFTVVDTTTIRRLNKLAYEFYESYPDSTRYYGELEIKLAKKINDIQGIADGSVQVASVCAFKGDYKRSEQLYNNALAIYKRMGYAHGLYNSYTGLGSIEDYLGNYDKAIQLYNQALQISKKGGNEADQADCYNLLGITYDNKGDYSKALDEIEQNLPAYKGHAIEDKFALLRVFLIGKVRGKEAYSQAIAEFMRLYPSSVYLPRLKEMQELNSLSMGKR